MNYSEIFKNWNGDITDESVNMVKRKVYELLPQWDGNKICVIPHKNKNEYLISNNKYSDEYTVVFNTHTSLFHVENKFFQKLLPDSFTIYKSFVNIKTNNSSTCIHMIFGRITGFHYLYCGYLTNDNSCTTFHEWIYNSEKEWNSSIDLIELNNNFKVLNETLAKEIMEYAFCGFDKLDERHNEWYYNGKWKEYTELGINSDCEFDHVSGWSNSFGEIQKINKYTMDELFSLNKFICVLKYYPYHIFECDNCCDNMFTDKTYFCKNNVILNLCKDCYDKNEHKFMDEKFELINDNIHEMIKIKCEKNHKEFNS